MRCIRSKISYSEALELFDDGERRVREEANFYCPEIVKILNKAGLKYKWQKLQKDPRGEINKDFSIVFIETSLKLPFGHFLCGVGGRWMNPWINLPDKDIEAGFREVLSGEPTYLIYKI